MLQCKVAIKHPKTNLAICPTEVKFTWMDPTTMPASD